MSDTIEHTGTPQEPGEDLRSVLGAAYDEVAARDAGEPAGAVQQERDEKGRFSSTNNPSDDSEGNAETETEAEPPAEPPIEPPKSWSEEEKSTWGDLSRKAQETILRREAAIERDLSERDRDLAPLRDVLAPYRDKHARMGLPQAEAVHRLLSWQDAIERNPDAAFRALMQSVGYDPNRLFTEPTTQETQAHNPEVAALHAEIAAIKHAVEAREMQATAAQIDAFAKDHPHFDAVRVVMGRLITADPSLSLQDAYDRAIWVDPGVREKLLAERAAREAEAQRKATADQAARARKAATSVRDSAPGRGAAAPSSGASLRADLERAWEEAARAA